MSKPPEKICYICGRANLSKDEIGIAKKLIGIETKRFYCISCLAEYLEVEVSLLKEKIEELKEQGCTLF